MRASRSLLALAAPLAAAAVLAAGCGDDEDAAETVTAPAPTVTVTETVTVPAPDTDEPGRTAPDGEAADCGDVGFEPQTDAGAFGIEATGVPCDVARRVAAAAESSRRARLPGGGLQLLRRAQGERARQGRVDLHA